MTDYLELSNYELGLIYNALRNKVIRLEGTRNYETLKDLEESEEIDIFCLELMVIKQKIKHILSQR